MDNLLTRSTKQVLEDHLRLRIDHDIEADIERNYSPEVVMLTAVGKQSGHDAVRNYQRILVEHVPRAYEIVVQLVSGRFAFIEWRAREPGRSVEDGADSFVIEGGKIVLQTIHYSLQETMPE
ncbi:MAG TPA: nuclear transport factor 2 family protein [Devosia sp.]|nr:nuclear transport factor 2 family protein [Devosia sp.]